MGRTSSTKASSSLVDRAKALWNRHGTKVKRGLLTVAGLGALGAGAYYYGVPAMYPQTTPLPVSKPRHVKYTDLAMPTKYMVSTPRNVHYTDLAMPAKFRVSKPRNVKYTDLAMPTKYMVSEPRNVNYTDLAMPAKYRVSKPRYVKYTDLAMPTKYMVSEPRNVKYTDLAMPAKYRVSKPRYVKYTDLAMPPTTPRTIASQIARGATNLYQSISEPAINLWKNGINPTNVYQSISEPAINLWENGINPTKSSNGWVYNFVPQRIPDDVNPINLLKLGAANVGRHFIQHAIIPELYPYKEGHIRHQYTANGLRPYKYSGYLWNDVLERGNPHMEKAPDPTGWYRLAPKPVR
jgi:hypothetical protein